MLDVRYSSKFRREFKSCLRRGYDIGRLQTVIDALRIPELLPPKNKDHSLGGNFSGYRECHIEPDWLLIYRQTENELLLYRTGTHSDLFD